MSLAQIIEKLVWLYAKQQPIKKESVLKGKYWSGISNSAQRSHSVYYLNSFCGICTKQQTTKKAGK
jgi:hypothetical protein